MTNKHLKSLLCIIMIMAGLNAWGDSFSKTYDYAGVKANPATWTLTNRTDKTEYWLVPSGSDPSIATLPGIFDDKIITSDVVVTINCATEGNSTNPYANTFLLYNEDSCNNQLAAIVGGSFPTTASTYTNVTYTIPQANAAFLSGDLAIKITKPGKLIRLKSIKVEFTYTDTSSLPKHTVTWNVNGTETSKQLAVGKAIPLQEPETMVINGLEFVGWHVAEYTNPSVAPEFVTSATMGTEDAKYYAVYADNESKTITLNSSDLEIKTYAQGTKTDDGGNIWNYYSTVSQLLDYGLYYYYFGLTSTAKNYNIASPVFAENITSIKIKGYNGDSSEDRKLYICSSNTTAQPTAGDIDEITIPKKEKFFTTFNVDLSRVNNLWQFYIYASAPLGVSEVKVTYGNKPYSHFTTTVPTSANITISSAGYATFVTPCALNFENSGVTAYTVSADLANSIVLLSPVTQVPAGKAIVVKGSEGTHAINAVASADAITTALTYSSEATAYSSTVDRYYLGVEGGEVGFRKLAEGGTIAAGKCFFETTAGAKFLTMSFDDELSGISTVENTENNGVAYNLAGQRVNANAKGIVIINGKKYFNK